LLGLVEQGLLVIVHVVKGSILAGVVVEVLHLPLGLHTVERRGGGSSVVTKTESLVVDAFPIASVCEKDSNHHYDEEDDPCVCVHSTIIQRAKTREREG
jgi:hypothetical protein